MVIKKIDCTAIDWQTLSTFLAILEVSSVSRAAERLGVTQSAVSQQILDISKAEWKSKIQPNGMLDDLDWKTVTAIAEIVHRPWIPHELNSKN